jgi:hypothetical protein
MSQSANPMLDCGPVYRTKHALFGPSNLAFMQHCIGNGSDHTVHARRQRARNSRNSLTKDSPLHYKPPQRDKRLEAIHFFAGWNESSSFALLSSALIVAMKRNALDHCKGDANVSNPQVGWSFRICVRFVFL